MVTGLLTGIVGVYCLPYYLSPMKSRIPLARNIIEWFTLLLVD